MKKLIYVLVPMLLLWAGCTKINANQTAGETVSLPTRAARILEQLKQPAEDYVLVVSHRGDWRYAPENSLEAVERCIELGVDVVEIDVRLTKDGHLVAMHDNTVDRTTNGTGQVSDLTLEEIKALRLKNGCGVRGSLVQVPTLEEIMMVAKDRILINLDKTEGKTVREAYEVLKKTGTIDHAIFKGNDSYQVMHEKYDALLDSIMYMPKLWYENDDVDNFMAEYERTLNPFMYETLFDSEQAKTFKLLPQLRKQGDTFLAIALWDELCAGHTDERTLLDGAESTYGWLVDQGANAIMTDRPQLLLNYLREKGLHD